MSDQEQLTTAVSGLTETVRGLSSRVEVADDLNDRTRKLDRLTGRLWKAIGALAVALALSMGTAYQARSSLADSQTSKTRTLCEALNASNAKNAQFWRDIIVKFPAAPPGIDATQSEKDAYAEGQARTAAFLHDVDTLGTPTDCP